jgi:hypothetical protein
MRLGGKIRQRTEDLILDAGCDLKLVGLEEAVRPPLKWFLEVSQEG